MAVSREQILLAIRKGVTHVRANGGEARLILMSLYNKEYFDMPDKIYGAKIKGHKNVENDNIWILGNNNDAVLGGLR